MSKKEHLLSSLLLLVVFASVSYSATWDSSRRLNIIEVHQDGQKIHSLATKQPFQNNAESYLDWADTVNFIKDFPSPYRLDLAWTVILSTSDLAGFNITWTNEANGTIVDECYVAGNQNFTQYSTFEDSCAEVRLEPCVNVIVDVLPVNDEGERIGVGVKRITYEVPSTDEINRACPPQLYPVDYTIDLQWFLINGNQAPVTCNLTWIDGDGKIVGDCSVNCYTPQTDLFLTASRDCPALPDLKSNTTYTVNVQPFDENGEPTGISASATGNTTAASNMKSKKSYGNSINSFTAAEYANTIEYSAVVPAPFHLDAIWTTALTTSDLVGFNITWHEKYHPDFIYGSCIVPGNENYTLYNTSSVEDCKKVTMEPCTEVTINITPVNDAGEAVGTITNITGYGVPLTDDINYVCDLRLHSQTDWIRAQWHLINGNQAPVICNVTYTDTEGNTVADCPVLFETYENDVELSTPVNCEGQNLEPSTTYTVKVQPVDGNGEETGTSASAVATTLP